MRRNVLFCQKGEQRLHFMPVLGAVKNVTKLAWRARIRVQNFGKTAVRCERNWGCWPPSNTRD
eukprot:3442053-Amphidinium_carterae.1